MSCKSVIVVHPDSGIRILLRTALEARGILVATDHSAADLLGWKSDLRPSLVLIDRGMVADGGIDLLSEIRRKWKETESVLLPEELSDASLGTLLGIVDRLLGMRTTGELLAV